MATQLKMPHKRRRTLDTVSRADRQQLTFRATSEERKIMQKHFITLTLALAFLVATNVQADMLKWSDAEPKVAQFDNIVTFIATPGGIPDVTPVGNFSWSDLDETIINGQFLVDASGHRVRTGPQTMEFGLTADYKEQYDGGFFVQLTNSAAFQHALQIGFVTYDNSGAEVKYDIIPTTVAGDWLDLGLYLERMKEGDMIRFTLDRTLYAGEVELNVYGAATPEPATLAVLGLGLAGLGVARRRMKK